MVEIKETRVQPFSFRENENVPEETNKTEEKDATLLQNASRKKSTSQKRRKVPSAPSGKTDIVEIREQGDKTENQPADDMRVDRMDSSYICEDEQEAPLSLKNFFKAVKSFSKRKPKGLKIPEEVAKEKKETDVVVFERLATPRSFYTSHRISRSLPPIMDIHDVLSPETQAEGEKLDIDRNCLHSKDVSRTSNTEGTYDAVTRSEPSNQSSAVRKRALRRHRCSGFLHELEPDGLQEFGSFGVSAGIGDGAHRISRKSLGYFRNTCEEHEALHF